MSNKIYLTISDSYVRDWGVWEALRELAQNTLDTKTGYDIICERRSIIFHTTAGKLEPKHLAMGVSSKYDDNAQLGKYGEGFKLALLVLLREGLSITIYNGSNEVWIPSFDTHLQLGVECLCIEIIDRECEQSDETVEFHVEGVDYHDIDTFESRVILNKDELEIIGQDPTNPDVYFWEGTDYNQGVYVGGIFVTETYGYKYSYNLSPERVSLDRDRNWASDYDVSYGATEVIIRSGKWDMLVDLAANGYKDVSNHVDMKREAGYIGGCVGGDSLAKLTSDVLVESVNRSFFDNHGEDAYPVSSAASNRDQIVRQAIASGKVPVIVNASIYEVLDEKYRTPLNIALKIDVEQAVLGMYSKYKDLLSGDILDDFEKLVENINLYKN